MKKTLLCLLAILVCSSSYAADYAQLKINIKDPVRENKYFLCLYGIGCLSIQAGDNGKVFPVPPTDIGNITKVVITDVSTMNMYAQPSARSCDVNLKDNQRLTISGHLIIKNNTPYIQGLSCRVV